MKNKRLNRGIFIIGTDTGVGKTLISGAIARSLVSSGIDCGVMKPIETGCQAGEAGLIPDDGHYLQLSACSKDSIDLISPCRYTRPLAPYAATIEGEGPLVLDNIQKTYKRQLAQHDFMVVEGLGGLLVPLTADLCLIDLILLFNLPVLLVARAGLGTLNHTLLSLRYGTSQGLSFLGIVLNRADQKENIPEKSNRKILSARTKLPVFETFPYLGDFQRQENLIEDACTRFNKDLKFKDRIYRLL